MRMLIAITLVLLPGLSFAQTNCRAIELPDHMEAVCIGDEKASPAPDTPSAAASQREEPRQQAAPQQMRPPAQSAAAPLPQPQTSAVAVTTSQSTAAQEPTGSVVHRQGRQQYKKGMDEARAARLQLISDLQQGKPAP